jgi:hypothetical protein
MTDDTTPPAERPAFDTLIAELRQEKLRKARRDGAVPHPVSWTTGFTMRRA